MEEEIEAALVGEAQEEEEVEEVIGEVEPLIKDLLLLLSHMEHIFIAHKIVLLLSAPILLEYLNLIVEFILNQKQKLDLLTKF